MGSRGSFLKSGGFSTPNRWELVGYVDGVKVLAPKDPKASISLPERSNTPGTAYVTYRPDGTFWGYICFGEDRMPIYQIDYSMHNGKPSLHVHRFEGEKRLGNPVELHPGDVLYEKHKNLFKGVRI